MTSQISQTSSLQSDAHTGTNEVASRPAIFIQSHYRDGPDANRPLASSGNRRLWNREDFIVRDLHGERRTATDFGVHCHRKPEEF